MNKEQNNKSDFEQYLKLIWAALIVSFIITYIAGGLDKSLSFLFFFIAIIAGCIEKATEYILAEITLSSELLRKKVKILTDKVNSKNV